MKLICIDNGNITHKAIFAYISQLKKEMLDIAYENNWVNEEGIILEEYWQDCYNLVMQKIKIRKIFVMSPVYTYFRMMISYLKKLGITLEDKILVCQDRGTWRKTIDKNYKAQRAEFRESFMPKWWWDKTYKEFNDFIPKLENSLPWHFPACYHTEADDIVSVAVRFIDAEEKLLISSDEDWQMLCSIPNTKVFSPYSKKFKIVKNPEKILLKKIKGDISDNLLTDPKTIAEYEKRKQIVDLLHLPELIEKPIREILLNLPIKQLYLEKIPFPSCRKAIKELYNL